MTKHIAPYEDFSLEIDIASLAPPQFDSDRDDFRIIFSAGINEVVAMRRAGRYTRNITRCADGRVTVMFRSHPFNSGRLKAILLAYITPHNPKPDCAGLAFTAVSKIPVDIDFVSL